MTRRSKIDILGIGDQVLLWAMNQDVRSISRKIKETTGTSVDFTAVSRYISQHNEIKPAIAEAKAIAIREVSRALIEEHFGRILAAAEEGFERCKADHDESAAQKYLATWEKASHDLATRIIPVPTTLVAVDARQQGGEGLKERLWKLVNEG